jgi:hypothetical protein
LLASEEGVSLYENKKALPRGFFAANVIQALTHEDALKLLGNQSFDPQSSAVIELAQGSDVEERPTYGPTSVTDKTTIAGDTRNLVVISTDSEDGGVLVLADNYYPGWRAMIDEQPAELLRANYTMRAVKVPPGRHVVYFEFDPPILKLATYVSLASAAVIGLALVFMFLRDRRLATEWR